MRLTIRVPLSCVVLCLLVACNDQGSPQGGEPPSSNTVEVAAKSPAAPLPVVVPKEDTQAPVDDGATRGGDGSPIGLLPLSAEQLEGANLSGELACSFADANAATLLVARADVVPDGMVLGVVNHNGYVETLANGRAGGFSDLLDGIVLLGKGLTLRLARGAATPTGNESTRHAATLTAQRADGAERGYAGTWTCGP